MKKILLIEDDIFLLKVYKFLLEKEGYSVITLKDGVRVLETTKKEQPSLIILDLVMPKKDGFEVLEELKADDQTKNVPVYALTLLQDPEDIKKVKNLGAEEYITKPSSSFSDVVKIIKTRFPIK